MYKTEIDQINKNEWESLVKQFEDSTIFQTYSYGVNQWGENRLSHVIIKKDRDVVAAAQIQIVKPPIIQTGIAYISWGPMWKLKNKPHDPEILKAMVKSLRKEYAVRRKLFLRIRPSSYLNGNVEIETVHNIFKSESFIPSLPTYRTLLLDMAPSLPLLRQNLKGSWRRNLKKAEHNDLQLIEGNGDQLFHTFKSLYSEMLMRKKFVLGPDIQKYEQIQSDLPDPLKMKIFLCTKDQKPIASTICTLIGDTGIYLLGASSNNGLDTRASYLLHWRMIEWLKQCGAKRYDLYGYNPQKRPGTSQFKSGLSAAETWNIGCYDISSSTVNLILIKNMLKLKENIKEIKIWLEHKYSNLKNK